VYVTYVYACQHEAHVYKSICVGKHVDCNDLLVSCFYLVKKGPLYLYLSYTVTTRSKPHVCEPVDELMTFQ
jgi:hypothetical protein